MDVSIFIFILYMRCETFLPIDIRKRKVIVIILMDPWFILMLNKTNWKKRIDFAQYTNWILLKWGQQSFRSRFPIILLPNWSRVGKLDINRKYSQEWWMCYRCCSISIEARKALLVLGPNKKFCCKSKSFVFVSPLDVLCLVQIIPTVLSLPPACPVSLLQFLHVFNKALGAVREGGGESQPALVFVYFHRTKKDLSSGRSAHSEQLSDKT